MTTGARDTLIRFERATVATDVSGVEVETWAPLITAWASVRYGTGSERRQIGQEGAALPATFRVLANAVTRALTPRDRIVMGTRLFNITSVAPAPGRAEIDVTAIERLD